MIRFGVFDPRSMRYVSESAFHTTEQAQGYVARWETTEPADRDRLVVVELPETLWPFFKMARRLRRMPKPEEITT